MNMVASNLPKVRPATDLIERGDVFYLYLNMPGVSKEQLCIEVEGDELSITGAAQYGTNRDERLHSLEFDDVEYKSLFALPESIDVQSISARLKNGVLEIAMPKYIKSEPKRIRINVE